ncbi:Pantothenate precursors transporter PanS [Methylobacterium brachiatum]|nr:Pantothenate precursors transporter PanS [Methylobacterium brachiatum]
MLLNRVFPVCAVLAAATAYVAPDMFLPILPHVAVLLAVIMFALGVTLTPADFGRILARPAPVATGVVVHYLVMPAAWAIAHALGMGTELTTGMVLVGSVASGTSSTLMVYIAGGDVALSVTVAVASTLVGLVATPLLVRFYVDAAVPVDVAGLLASLVEIVAAPVAVGLALNRLAPRLVGRFERALPVVSMAAILLIIGAVVAGSRASIAAVGPLVLLAVALHNGAGLVCGYWSGRLLGFDESTCRTLALEVGMQNSGLAAALGKLYFSPLAALPGAVFSVWHNLSGSILAGHWSGQNRAVATRGTAPR